jgi:cobalt-zinc-cadmium efflux system protein
LSLDGSPAETVFAQATLNLTFMERQHGHVHALDAQTSRSRAALGMALALIAGFTVVELAAGFLAGSLALLADAAHMVSDTASLGLAFFAAWLALRPATPRRSFGFRRAEILAALFNGVALVAVSIWIFVAAIGRLGDPPEVPGGWILVVGLVGLAVNVAAAWVLARAGAESLNVRAALAHVLADALGSAGVILAGAVVLLTGWDYADPVAALAIAVLVLVGAWRILRESVAILLEAAPPGIDAEEVGRALVAAEGVVEVHDLHIWTITSGFPALSAHVLVAPGGDCHGVRRDLERLLHERFDLHHTTLQVEHVGTESLVEIGPSYRRRSPLRR